MLVLTFHPFDSFFIEDSSYQVVRTNGNGWAVRTQNNKTIILHKTIGAEIFPACRVTIAPFGQQVKISFQAPRNIKITRSNIRDEDYNDTLCMPNVTERTIDQILEEEFLINPEFFQLFLLKCFQSTLTQNATVTKSYRSVTQTRSGGDESDVIILFEHGEKAYALLIENKINASKQDKQPERYIERGISGIRGGLWDAFETVLIAPNSYIEARKEHDLFHNYVSYEHIIQILEITITDLSRQKYRTNAFSEAIQKKQQYVRLPDIEDVVEFVGQFTTDATKQLKEIEISFDPPNKKIIWFYISKNTYPSGVRIIVQYEAVVAQFQSSAFDLLSTEVKNAFEKEGFIQQDSKSGQSTTFRKSVAPVNCLMSYNDQINNMQRCIDIIKELDDLILRELTSSSQISS